MAQDGRTVIVGSLRSYLCVCFLILINGAIAQWVVDDDGCPTPDGGVGSCIPVKQCKPMTDFLMNVPKPLSQKVITYLNAYTCGYESGSTKVCCPPTPIVFTDDTAPSPVTEEPPPPPDVSNHRNFNLLPKECGLIGIPDRIINGANANLNEFPWMALLSYNTRRGPNFQCGGSIVNDRWILTAAHCITDLKNPLLGVRVGEHNINTRVDCVIQENKSTKCNTQPVQDLAIEEVHVHPQYNATVISNDIGLLKVTRMNLPVENVQPICLPIGKARNATFENAVVTGWGITATGQSSTVLQKVELPMVDLKACQNVYKTDPKARITYRQLCAGGKDNKDSCPGDSGGPMQAPIFLNDDTRYVQQGIVSFGPRFCGLEGYPGVYTRISYYMEWILDTIHP